MALGGCMDTKNDFRGSFADENVLFDTRVLRSARVGDNYWKVMIFIEDDRYVTSTDWKQVPGATESKMRIVNSTTYASEVNSEGALFNWLLDLYANGFTGDCILVTVGAKLESAETEPTAIITQLKKVFPLVSPYAYHKTCLIGVPTETGTDIPINATVGLEFAKLCATERQLLSSAPYYPYCGATMSDTSSCALFTQIKADPVADAFMSANYDCIHNAALYSLGLAMSLTNESGTCVGNSMDMIKSNNIGSSGVGGTVPTKEEKDTYKANFIQYFKPVGDNSGSVAALGAETIKGNTVQADWIVAYVTYMTKVAIAKLITVPNFIYGPASYNRIVNKLVAYLALFGPNGSNRLADLIITAPSFENLPESSGDEYIIPDAWSAVYRDQVRTVKITGALYLGGDL